MMQGRHVIKAGRVSRAGSSKEVRPFRGKLVRPFCGLAERTLYSPAEQALGSWLMFRFAAARFKVTVSSHQHSSNQLISINLHFLS